MYHNWHILLTIRHLNGVRRVRPLTKKEEALWQNTKDYFYADVKETKEILKTRGGFISVYPPIMPAAPEPVLDFQI